MYRSNENRFEDQDGKEVQYTRLVTDPDVGVTLSPLISESYLKNVLAARSISRINFESIGWLEEDCLKLIPRLCKASLLSLVLDRCNGVTDAVLQELGFNTPALQELSIRECPKVTLTGVNAVLEQCQDLVRLDLSQNPTLCSVPEASRDDDLIDLYEESVPRCLRTNTVIRTCRDTRDLQAELYQEKTRFAAALKQLVRLKELRMEGIKGVDDELLVMIFGESSNGEQERKSSVSSHESATSSLEGTISRDEDINSEGEEEGEEKKEEVLEEKSREKQVHDNKPTPAEHVTKQKAVNKSLESQQVTLTQEDIQGEKDEEESKREPHGPLSSERGGEQLEVFVLSGCSQVTSVGLVAVAGSCPKLAHVEIGMLTRIRSRGILAFAEQCESLVTVDLTGLRGVRDSCIETLCELHGKSLTRLGLAGCSGLRGGCLTSISTHCTELRELNLTGCTNIEGTDLLKLFSGKTRQLEKLILNACYQIDATVFEDIKATAKVKLPALRVIRLRSKPVGDPNSSGLVPNWRPLPTSQQLRAIAKEGAGKRKPAGKKKK